MWMWTALLCSQIWSLRVMNVFDCTFSLDVYFLLKPKCVVSVNIECVPQKKILIGSMITLCCFYPTSNGLLQSKNIFASRWYTVQPYEEKCTNLYELVVCIFLPSNITHNQHRREHQTEFIETISEYDKKIHWLDLNDAYILPISLIQHHESSERIIREPWNFETKVTKILPICCSLLKLILLN